VISFIQDNLHNFGRNPDKEVGAHIGKRSTTEPTLPARSSVQDVYGSGVQHIIADNGYGEEPSRLRRQASNSSLDTVALRHILHSSAENDGGANTGGSGGGDGGGDTGTKFASFANLSRQSSEKGINFTYMEQERLDDAKLSKKHGQSNGNGNGEKKTTFATLPNTTTWQQQSSQHSQQMEQHSIGKAYLYALD
jgi:calmodulin-regulated spectrin-associated protein